ncbi:7004_t:CDS:1, partial [Paraglomus occultum]
DYHVGDIVRLGIPAPDGQKRLLLCKMMEVLDSGWYRLGCSLGIQDTHYQAAGLEVVEAAYGGLDGIPETTISLTVLVGDRA